MSGISRISAATLRDWVRNGKSIAIIDVREDDYVGGSIKGSTNFPAYKLNDRMQDVIKTAENKDAVGKQIVSAHAYF